MFYNPYNTNEVWVTSFGGGLRLGRLSEPAPEFESVQAATNGSTRLRISAQSGQRLLIRASTNLLTGWQTLATNIVRDAALDFSDWVYTNRTPRFYSAAAVP